MIHLRRALRRPEKADKRRTLAFDAVVVVGSPGRPPGAHLLGQETLKGDVAGGHVVEGCAVGWEHGGEWVGFAADAGGNVKAGSGDGLGVQETAKETERPLKADVDL